MPKVSILIPTYNVEQYLVECMDSVVNQTLEDIEIICINDGSTDGSLEILKKYAANDARVVIIDKENGGYGMAMNKGLDRATGEYIGIVEPDDFVPLNMYKDLYTIAKENDLDFVKADFYRFKRNEKNGDMTLKYFHLTEDEEDYSQVFNPSEEPRRLEYVMNTWSGIYKREFIEKNHIRHNETPGASFQDNGFYFQTFVFGQRAMIVNKPYYMNRRDNPNSSVHNPGKVYCVNIEYDHIREILVDHPDIWNRFKYMYWKKRFTNCLATIDRIGDEYKTEYTEFIAKEFKRAMDAGLVRQSEFTEYQWRRLQFIIKDPQGFAHTKLSASGNNTDAEKRLNEVMSSTSYKLGFAITGVPRKIKTTLKKIKRKILNR